MCAVILEDLQEDCPCLLLPCTRNEVCIPYALDVRRSPSPCLQMTCNNRRLCVHCVQPPCNNTWHLVVLHAAILQ